MKDLSYDERFVTFALMHHVFCQQIVMTWYTGYIVCTVNKYHFDSPEFMWHKGFKSHTENWRAVLDGSYSSKLKCDWAYEFMFAYRYTDFTILCNNVILSSMEICI